MALLELRNVKKSYGPVDVIHGIDITVQSGEFCVFVGPSGCGKSTLLRMIAGLEQITDGEIAIDDERLNEVAASERGLAMVFQSYALYPHMSVRNNLSFGLENISTPKPEIDQRVNEAARMLQIEDYLDRKPGQLSGGQRQRVAIGRAVVREPRVFLFDEPLSNLDAELRVATRGEISALHKRLGNTMVYVTHDQVEAMTMADKIAVLRAGRLEQFGPPLDLFNAPANRFVAGFIGSPKMNFVKGTMGEGGRFISDGGAEVQMDTARFKTRPNQAVELGVRPSHTSPSDGGIPLKVRAVEQLGTETFVYGAVDGAEEFAMQLAGQVNIQPDTVQHVAIDAAAAHLFDLDTGLSCAQ
ncbi:ABC transporter ATP-binding protein [Gymnodinialimonas ulvae]|uniref:ABC transporter ATP-binding protein n=1 Tax=Gymnodinialimonas ulvae TaxID=3126504 RepID=UPI0030964117